MQSFKSDQKSSENDNSQKEAKSNPLADLNTLLSALHSNLNAMISNLNNKENEKYIKKIETLLNDYKFPLSGTNIVLTKSIYEQLFFLVRDLFSHDIIERAQMPGCLKFYDWVLSCLPKEENHHAIELLVFYLICFANQKEKLNVGNYAKQLTARLKDCLSDATSNKIQDVSKVIRIQLDVLEQIVTKLSHSEINVETEIKELNIIITLLRIKKNAKAKLDKNAKPQLDMEPLSLGNSAIPIPALLGRNKNAAKPQLDMEPLSLGNSAIPIPALLGRNKNAKSQLDIEPFSLGNSAIPIPALLRRNKNAAKPQLDMEPFSLGNSAIPIPANENKEKGVSLLRRVTSDEIVIKAKEKTQLNAKIEQLCNSITPGGDNNTEMQALECALKDLSTKFSLMDIENFNGLRTNLVNLASKFYCYLMDVSVSEKLVIKEHTLKLCIFALEILPPAANKTAVKLLIYFLNCSFISHCSDLENIASYAQKLIENITPYVQKLIKVFDASSLSDIDLLDGFEFLKKDHNASLRSMWCINSLHSLREKLSQFKADDEITQLKNQLQNSIDNFWLKKKNQHASLMPKSPSLMLKSKSERKVNQHVSLISNITSSKLKSKPESSNNEIFQKLLTEMQNKFKPRAKEVEALLLPIKTRNLAKLDLQQIQKRATEFLRIPCQWQETEGFSLPIKLLFNGIFPEIEKETIILSSVELEKILLSPVKVHRNTIRDNLLPENLQKLKHYKENFAEYNQKLEYFDQLKSKFISLEKEYQTLMPDLQQEDKNKFESFAVKFNANSNVNYKKVSLQSLRTLTAELTTYKNKAEAFIVTTKNAIQEPFKLKPSITSPSKKKEKTKEPSKLTAKAKKTLSIQYTLDKKRQQKEEKKENQKAESLQLSRQAGNNSGDGHSCNNTNEISPPPVSSPPQSNQSYRTSESEEKTLIPSIQNGPILFRSQPTPKPKVSPTPEPKVSPTPEPKVSPTPKPKVSPTPKPKVSPTPKPKVSFDPLSQTLTLNPLVKIAFFHANLEKLNQILRFQHDANNPDHIKIKSYALLAVLAVIGELGKEISKIDSNNYHIWRRFRNALWHTPELIKILKDNPEPFFQMANDLYKYLQKKNNISSCNLPSLQLFFAIATSAESEATDHKKSKATLDWQDYFNDIECFRRSAQTLSTEILYAAIEFLTTVQDPNAEISKNFRHARGIAKSTIAKFFNAHEISLPMNFAEEKEESPRDSKKK